MAEDEVFEAEERGFVTLPDAGELGVFYATMRAETQAETQAEPLLGPPRPRGKASVQTETDGADRATSVPQELGWAGRGRPGCSGSVRSLCSDSSRRGECPICGELFGPSGEALLNCDHALCHRCIAGILCRAKDPGRLQCPFCRQTTPFPEWEIRRLQEESYSVYAPRLSLVVDAGPESRDAAAAAAPVLCCCTVEAHTDTNVLPPCVCEGARVARTHILCLSIITLLLLFLVLMGCFLYIVLPATIISLL